MKLYRFLVMASVLLLAFTSCKTEETIDGHDLTQGPDILGFANPTVTESYFEDLGTIEKNYPINVYPSGDGVATDKDAVVNIAVNTDETTATGGEYVLNATSLTIPAGEPFVNLPVGIVTGNFNPTEPTKVVFDLTTSTDGFVVNSLQSRLTINFVGCQSLLADYTYSVVITREDGPVYGPHIEPLTMESVNHFLTYSVGSWDPPLNPGHGVRFEDICGDLYIQDQDLADMYSNKVYAAAGPNHLGGHVDAATGDFTLDYFISFSTGDLKHTAVYTRQ